MSDDAKQEETSPPVGAFEHVTPELDRTAFHCPYCDVYAQQWWRGLTADSMGAPAGVRQSTCANCHLPTYWLLPSRGLALEAPRMLWPIGAGSAPVPHPDLPRDPRADYEEARSIVDRSPRGAAALLRLALQKLCAQLGGQGRNIDADIAYLVQQGLSPGVQQALDSLRVIGNNALHPGQMDLRDDTDTATALFSLLNFIVEQTITRPKELQSIYSRLPAGALAAIEKRDGGPSAT